MTRNFKRTVANLLIVIAVTVVSLPLCAGELTISLGETPQSVSGQRITIGDVAEISGGTTSLRRRIADLDLDTLKGTSSTCRVSRRHIELRVLFDGYPRSQFKVVGPDEVVVRCTASGDLREKLEQLFAAEIARQFSLDREAIAVRLVNEQQIEAAESELSSADFSADVVFPSQLPIGKSQIQVEFESPDGNRFLARFETQVLVSLDVAVATQKIPRGTTVDQQMFRVIRRPILSKIDFAEPGQVIGRIAKRDISSNDVVLDSYLADPRTNQKPIINRYDLLDVIVELGQSQIRLKNAKALSAGNLGESIVVLNTRSNKQFRAKVVAANLAIVPQTRRGVR
jgi:flagella basal body P-ring formation protein FlgA